MLQPNFTKIALSENQSKNVDIQHQKSHDNRFVHPIFRSWFLITFGDKVTKILCNLCLHFARQDGQGGRKRKENHATKVTKIPKTKR